MKEYILLIETENDKSLVHNISGILFMHDVEIINNKEFVEKEINTYFKRTEFRGAIDDVRLIYDLYLALPKEAKIQLVEKRKKDIVVFCSKEHHCLGDLLIKDYYGEINSNIKAVISNHEYLRPLVEKFNIPFQYVSHENKTRDQMDREIYEILQDFNPEYLVLAKYMRIITPFLIDKFVNRIINIHHSFLPAFVGANPYKQAYERGVKIIGATAHFVTAELDQGPIIVQDVIKVDHSQTPRDLSKEGKELERNLLSKSLDLAFNDRIFVTGNKTIIF